jgi:hypothetical protein
MNELEARSTISAVSSVRNLDVTRKSYAIGKMDEDNEIGSIYSDYLDTDGPQVLKMLDKQSDGEGTLFEMLTPSQQGIFGDRCPDGFKKLAIIDRSDSSVMWLAQSPHGQ